MGLKNPVFILGEGGLVRVPLWGRVTVASDFAVRGQLSQSLHHFSEGGTLFEAQRPAAQHELVDSGGTSIWNGQLQLPILQS